MLRKRALLLLCSLLNDPVLFVAKTFSLRAPGGVLAFNLSNRYLDLDPVLGRQAGDADMACRIGHDIVVSPEEKQAGKQPSIWAVIAATSGSSWPWPVFLTLFWGIGLAMNAWGV